MKNFSENKPDEDRNSVEYQLKGISWHIKRMADGQEKLIKALEDISAKIVPNLDF